MRAESDESLASFCSHNDCHTPSQQPGGSFSRTGPVSVFVVIRNRRAQIEQQIHPGAHVLGTVVTDRRTEKSQLSGSSCPVTECDSNSTLRQLPRVLCEREKFTGRAQVIVTHSPTHMQPTLNQTLIRHQVEPHIRPFDTKPSAIHNMRSVVFRRLLHHLAHHGMCLKKIQKNKNSRRTSTRRDGVKVNRCAEKWVFIYGDCDAEIMHFQRAVELCLRLKFGVGS